MGGGVAGEVEEDVEEGDELDANVLDGMYLAGERFDRMVKRSWCRSPVEPLEHREIRSERLLSVQTGTER